MALAKQALVEHRPWLLASVIASVAYFFLSDGDLPGLQLAVLKASGVALLAVYALRRASGGGAIMIALYLALCALADFAIEFSFLAGGAIFAAAHLFAIALFLRNRRRTPSASQKLLGVALLIGVPAIAALITMPRENWQLAVSYAAVLAVMAASAWTSRFPRYRVGMGAVLFVVSDLVIFARESGQIDGELAGWLVWPLYYAAQLMIATGVVQTLRHEKVVA